MPERPPRLAERLLVRMTGGDAEAIAGDLREAFAIRGGGRLWYWGQVVSWAAARLSHPRLLPGFHHDLRQAVRLVRRNPGYALTATLCLALGIGVNTTVFSALDGIFLRPLPVPEAGRVVLVDRNGGPVCSWKEFAALRPALQAFMGTAAIIPKGTFLDIRRRNDQIYAEVVSANYGEVLRTPAQLGRWFVAAEDSLAAEPVAVISDRIWEEHFRRDPGALGALIRVENQPYRVVGVAAPEFHGTSAPLLVDAWVPLATFPHYRAELASGGPGVWLIGRLAGRRSARDAEAEWRVLDARLRGTRRGDPPTQQPVAVRRAAGYLWRQARRTAAPIAGLLLALVGMILAIACVNVANLLLSRAAARRREMALRLSLGATRGRLARQALAEGLVLAAGGASVGLVAGWWTSRALSAWLPAAVPDLALRTVALGINWRVAAATAGLALFSALLFSLAPALENARTELALALKGQGGAAAGGRPSRRRDAYAVAQVALSLVLLIGAGLLLRALARVAHADPGFATDRRLYVRLFTPEPDFTPETSMRLFSKLLDEAYRLPGVRDATLSFAMLGFTDSDCAATERNGARRRLSLNVVEPNYFRVMQVPLVRGRNFGAADRPNSPRVVIVNETLARRWWPGQDAVGKTLWLGCGAAPAALPAQVIGIARDSKYLAFDEPERPFYYVSARQVWWNGFFALILHTERDPYELAEPLLKLARSGGESLRIYELRSVEELVALSLSPVRLFAALLGVLAALAMALAAIGLYAVVSYSVAQRTHEIGIRMALGGRRRDVQRMVLGRGLRLGGVGVLAGLVLGAGGARLLRGFLHGVSPLDPAAYAAAALAWLGIALLAGYVPSRRATRVDPALALRQE